MFLHMEEPSELVDQCFHLYHIQIDLQNRLVAQSVKNLLEIQETWVQSLGWEDPLEKEMAIHSSILAWRIPMDRGVWWATVHGVTRIGHNLATKLPPPQTQ